MFPTPSPSGAPVSEALAPLHSFLAVVLNLVGSAATVSAFCGAIVVFFYYIDEAGPVRDFRVPTMFYGFGVTVSVLISVMTGNWWGGALSIAVLPALFLIRYVVNRVLGDRLYR